MSIITTAVEASAVPVPQVCCHDPATCPSECTKVGAAFLLERYAELIDVRSVTFAEATRFMERICNIEGDCEI